MKHKIAAIFTSLALVSSFFIAGQSQVQAAGSTSFSALAKIASQAINDAHDSDVGEVCVTVDALGTHTGTKSKSFPPMNYLGARGDRWIYIERFEIEMFQYKYLYWDGSIWLEWSTPVSLIYQPQKKVHDPKLLRSQGSVGLTPDQY